MRSKKGSHVGFVISFVLFVTFVIFMYVILSARLDPGQNKKGSLESLSQEVMANVSGNLTTTSVNVNSGSGGCFHFIDFLSNIQIGNRFIVQNDSGIIFPSSYSSNDLYVNKAGITTSNFFKVYSSSEFPTAQSGAMGSCVDLNKGSGYTLGLSKQETIIFESKVLSLFNSYNDNYTAVRDQFSVFPGDDFGLIFNYHNGTSIETPGENQTISVFADTIPVKYVNTNSTVETGSIEVLIW